MPMRTGCEACSVRVRQLACPLRFSVSAVGPRRWRRPRLKASARARGQRRASAHAGKSWVEFSAPPLHRCPLRMTRPKRGEDRAPHTPRPDPCRRMGYSPPSNQQAWAPPRHHSTPGVYFFKVSVPLRASDPSGRARDKSRVPALWGATVPVTFCGPVRSSRSMSLLGREPRRLRSPSAAVALLVAQRRAL
ncbi:hypothetical protein NDU88_003980 [Pleurodeles waltl]|uniref:Uncharacterized protein n=1 Tax=Pleurodeles waltl TaxID=8319 RepID=A0AAV7LH01_PLEWA|nr:hypothetical protein NDU88_003980 [Pleurodeles waltl]